MNFETAPITKLEYNKLNSNQKALFNSQETKTEQTGFYSWWNIVPISYIKKEIKEKQNSNKELILDSERNKIIKTIDGIINKSEYNKLKSNQKDLFTVYDTETEQTGVQSGITIPKTYIRKDVKKRLNSNKELILDDERNKIIKTIDGIINKSEYKKLKPNQKDLFTVYDTETEQTGIQSWNTIPKTYIRKDVKKRLNSIRKKINKNERNNILKKTEITIEEYNLLTLN